MATLTGELISETYDSLLKVTDNNTITGVKKRITDGFGNEIPLQLSSTDIEIDGTLILSALTDLEAATKFLSLKADNSVAYRTAAEVLTDIGGASSSSISGTTGNIAKFTSTGAVGDSILEEIGNAIHLTDGTSSYASFGIINPGVDNDAYIGSTINNDFIIRVNNTEALRIDTNFRLTIANIQNALYDTDKFLVSEGGVVKYRTGAEVLVDIGAGVGSVTSVGLTMPPAFSVANSPITSSGTLAVTGAGTASQYIRGDGSLATIPATSSGGSSVNYYLNGSIPASVGGYFQMDNSPVIGTGTDFTLTGDGLIAQFLTDAGNPNRLLIPGGAWNFEMYFNVSSVGGNTKFYVELLKYNGTTFTSIASSAAVPEEITSGTTIDLYVTSIAVPQTTLLITDRLALRVYIVDNSGGRTVTLHTEDNTLCEVITTFAGGISALNGLTANTQYFGVGTTGSNFNISSVSDTHTFNLPNSSSINRGALTSADWITFNAKQNAITLTTTGSSGAATLISDTLNIPNYTLSGLGGVPTSRTLTINGTAFDLSANRSWSVGTVTSVAALTLGTSGTDLNSSVSNPTTTPVITLNVPDASASNRGVITTGIQTIAGEKTFSSASSGQTLNIQNSGTGYGLRVQSGGAYFQDDITIQGFLKSVSHTYTLPSATGTLALTSNITSAISGTTNYIPKFTGANTIGNSNLINDSSGNLGLGVTPSAWGSTYLGFQIGSGSAIGGRTDGLPITLYMSNTYLDSSVISRYIVNKPALRYVQDANGGSHWWDVAPSGTAGNAISFTQAMTLTAGGNLGVGTASAGVKLQSNISSSGLPVTPGTTQTNGALRLSSAATSGIIDFGINGSNNWIQSTDSGDLSQGYNLLLNPRGGNVLIGTTTDAGYKLDVNGTGRFSQMITAITGNGNVLTFGASGQPAITLFQNSTSYGYYNNTSGVNNLLINNSTGAATFSSLGTGTVYSNGGTLTNTNPSDKNLKTEIQDLSYGLNEIMQLRPVSYLWKDDKINQGKQFGFIAQEVKEVMPDLVKEGDYLGLDKEAIFVTLINAIKELNEKITQLENK